MTEEFIPFGLLCLVSGGSVSQGTSSDIFSCLLVDQKKPEQRALVTWTAFELESYVVERVSTAASSSLPYLKLKTNLSYTQTWKFT